MEKKKCPQCKNLIQKLLQHVYIVADLINL